MTPEHDPESEHCHAHGGLVEPAPQKVAAKIAAAAVGQFAGRIKARRKSFAPGKTCDHSITAGNSSGHRTAGTIRLVIIHCTESPNPGAHGVAGFFAGGGSAGSTQLIVDDEGCYRTLDDFVIPWGAPGANTQGVHIEQCGYGGWTRAQWLAHLKTIKRTAYKAAKACRRYGIPPVWLSAGELRAGKPGVSSHANVSAAWHRTDHTDPGPNYPYDKFKFWLKHYHEAMR